MSNYLFRSLFDIWDEQIIYIYNEHISLRFLNELSKNQLKGKNCKLAGNIWKMLANYKSIKQAKFACIRQNIS